MYTDFNVKDGTTNALELDGSGNGVFELLDIPRDGKETFLQVSFYTEETLENRVAATAGAVQIVGAIDSELIWKTVADGSFNASEAYNEDQTIPNALGPMANIQVRFTNCAGNALTHARVFLVRY